jgi:hypothetical protein
MAEIKKIPKDRVAVKRPLNPPDVLPRTYRLPNDQYVCLQWTEMSAFATQRLAAFVSMRDMNGDDNVRTPEGWLDSKQEEFADRYMHGIDAVNDNRLEGMIFFRRRAPSRALQPVEGAIECLWVGRQSQAYQSLGMKLLHHATSQLRLQQTAFVTMVSSNKNAVEYTLLRKAGWRIEANIPETNSRIFKRALAL